MTAEAAVDYVKLMHDTRESYRHDAVGFCQNILKLRRLPGEPSLDDEPDLSWEMDEWQVQASEAVCDVVRKKDGVPTVVNHKGLNMITVTAMHGPGKTIWCAMMMHWFRFCFPAVMPCTAPKMKQVKTRLFKEFTRLRRRSESWYASLMKVDAEQILWPSPDPDEVWDKDYKAFAETAASPENIAGLHERYMLFIVDESTGVDEALWPALFGALATGYIVILIMISNPTKRTGVFADSHLKPGVRDDYYRMQISLDKTKRVSLAWVESMKRKYGENSPVYKVRCLGKFADADENQLVAFEWVADAFNRELEPDGSLPRVKVTLDVADGGLAETCATGALHYDSFVRGVKQYTYNFAAKEAPAAAGRAAAALFDSLGGDKKNGRDYIVVDYLGPGTGSYVWLVGAGYPVVAYKGGEAAVDPKSWANRRTQSHCTARDGFRDSAVCFDDDFCVNVREQQEFEAQVTAIKTIPGDERLEKLQTKDQAKAENPDLTFDRSDSWAMQYYFELPTTTTPPLGLVVARGTEWRDGIA